MQSITDLIERRFGTVHNAKPSPCYPDYVAVGDLPSTPRAALGVRFAGRERLFLEAYLDGPIETVISRAMEKPVSRDRIVEIGCLAADQPAALMQLLLETAERLDTADLIATATLTLPLQSMFKRIGMPLVRLATADPARVHRAVEWGSYYAQAPAIFAGDVASGAAALGRYAARFRNSARQAVA